MGSILSVEQLRGLSSGDTPNTITLPTGQTLDFSAGTLTMPAGHVVQVKNYRPAASIDISATSYTDLFSLAITPKSADNAIFAIIHGGVYATFAAQAGFLVDLRTDSESGLTRGEYVFFQANGSYSWNIVNANIQTIHYPNTTDEVTYYVQGRSTASAYTTSTRGGFGLTLMEIAG
jgi:hypothetical protein